MQSTHAISRNGAPYENRSDADDVLRQVVQESFTPQAGHTRTAVYRFDNAAAGSGSYPFPRAITPTDGARRTDAMARRPGRSPVG